MKHHILSGLVSLLAGTAAFAGTTPVVESPIAPVQQQLVRPASHPWAVEVSVANVFATKTLFGADTKKFNLAGPELTGVYTLNQNSAFTLRGSALYGRHGHSGIDDAGYTHPLGKLDLILMPGYRYTHTVSPNTSVYAGVNVGVIFTDVNKRHSYKLNISGEESAIGLAASAELGVKYSINKAWYVLAAYQISGDTARPTVYDVKQESQFYHGFRLGVGHEF